MLMCATIAAKGEVTLGIVISLKCIHTILYWHYVDTTVDQWARFAEISPFWHNFKSIWKIFEVLFGILQSVDLTLAKKLCY